MAKKQILKPIGVAITTAMLSTASFAGVADGANTLFQLNPMSESGSDHEGSCGEGSCGESSSEGKCGEGRCGGSGEGSCGEGSCGG